MSTPVRLGNRTITIDRPQGTQKEFPTPTGKTIGTYPVDYGYVNGSFNPEDNEPADIFVGQGGPHHGRFMKGQNLDGEWRPDERKWYVGLTANQLTEVIAMFETQSKGLLRDFVQFPTVEELLADLP